MPPTRTPSTQLSHGSQHNCYKRIPFYSITSLPLTYTNVLCITSIANTITSNTRDDQRKKNEGKNWAAFVGWLSESDVGRHICSSHHWMFSSKHAVGVTIFNQVFDDQLCSQIPSRFTHKSSVTVPVMVGGSRVTHRMRGMPLGGGLASMLFHSG